MLLLGICFFISCKIFRSPSVTFVSFRFEITYFIFITDFSGFNWHGSLKSTFFPKYVSPIFGQQKCCPQGELPYKINLGEKMGECQMLWEREIKCWARNRQALGCSQKQNSRRFVAKRNVRHCKCTVAQLSYRNKEKQSCKKTHWEKAHSRKEGQIWCVGTISWNEHSLQKGGKSSRNPVNGLGGGNTSWFASAHFDIWKGKQSWSVF